MKTKSSAAPVLSSSYFSKTDIDTLSSLKHRESIQLLLKLTLLNSLYGGYDKDVGPSRLSTKSRNFTSTVSELDSLLSPCTLFLLFSVSASFVFIRSLKNTLNDPLNKATRRKHKLISTSSEKYNCV